MSAESGDLHIRLKFVNIQAGNSSYQTLVAGLEKEIVQFTQLQKKTVMEYM